LIDPGSSQRLVGFTTLSCEAEKVGVLEVGYHEKKNNGVWTSGGVFPRIKNHAAHVHRFVRRLLKDGSAEMESSARSRTPPEPVGRGNMSHLVCGFLKKHTRYKERGGGMGRFPQLLPKEEDDSSARKTTGREQRESRIQNGSQGNKGNHSFHMGTRRGGGRDYKR